MTYPVNSDGPRKPIDSLAEELRGKKENTTLPLLVKPSRRGTPNKGDLIPQDSSPLPKVTIIGKDGRLYREGEKVGQLKDNVRPYREKILDHFANEMSAQDLRDWAEEFRLRAKEK